MIKKKSFFVFLIVACLLMASAGIAVFAINNINDTFTVDNMTYAVTSTQNMDWDSGSDYDFANTNGGIEAGTATLTSADNSLAGDVTISSMTVLDIDENDGYGTHHYYFYDVNGIAPEAFNNCSDIASLDIPAAIDISNVEFLNCSSLETITYGAVTYRRVSVESANSSIGSVSVTGGLGINDDYKFVAVGDTCQINAYANSGYSFKNWIEQSDPSTAITTEGYNPVVGANSLTYTASFIANSSDNNNDNDDDEDSPPTTKISKDWTNIGIEIDNASEGTEIDVSMNDAKVLPSSIISKIKDRDITLVLDMVDYYWTVNGNDVTAAKDVNLSIKQNVSNLISSDLISNLAGDCSTVQMRMNYDGDLGFTGTLTINLGKENKDLYANLYYYNPATNKLEYQTNGIIDSNGDVDLIFSHASKCVIILDNKTMADEISAGEPVTDITVPIFSKNM